MSGAHWKSWQAMEKAIARAAEAQAGAQFVHPGDAIDARETRRASAAAPGPRFGDVFAAMNAACLPSRSFGVERRWLAGYHRYVAVCYRVTPEMFENMTRTQIAKRLGISLRAFGKQLQFVDEILDGRVPPVMDDER